ncbi:MAG: cysteine desulfurase [Pseudanabaena sp. M158S2SP1A06QC]|jgi:cysteine desulfurase|nr:cysteine desulfurase [Pseudanabaena sp. M53BS1SP1A06MG]MCA6581754.1 cysteine desulfurase [Pseudanabaena sp. M34BS1SP1A06MG]MCA6593222.1 cysteine desulfurase [Pseudanabaena sp. M38BS1SP1A06MG]MCA6597359.1 cysteine desulfurase [Pseudanabaena sp. M046S1SP1A06QC]MCA6600643.1 cysteine desulfurase [Pseudanabaena sp. M57BS1SP1A06MG]MCA6612187.1 cysteine desulfurase [Pseudanabaena sp. M158S2SP1A06QC]MCA6622995.1 cysteine desulfurase [Pseudanabaena sp. M165S2SP1A06QC]
MQIYLDHSATSPVRPEVIELMTEVMRSQWGNPSSLHAWGERSTMAIERARLQVASLLNADPEGIIFTSGGTEADNMALMGIARLYQTPQHIIISSVEHSAVRLSAQYLEQHGWEITRLSVDRDGKVSPQDLGRSLRPNTVLVSVIAAQNEVGTIQPIDKLGQICRNANVPFHTDAVQAITKMSINVQTLPIDLLSLSAHKFYGGQGIGALYVNPLIIQKNGLVPLNLGGGQERGYRSGTQAVAAIAGLGLAAELAAKELVSESQRLTKLRDHLYALLTDIPDLIPTGSSNRLPHHLSFYHKYLDGRRLVRELSYAGIAISSGSACSSGAIEPSAILLAMGYSDSEARNSIRITLGKSTTEADIEWTALAIHQILSRV